MTNANSRFKLLVGYDGSASADAAIRDLGRAGLPPAGDVRVVSALDVSLEAISIGFSAPEQGGVGAMPLTVPSLAGLVEIENERARRIAAQGAALVSRVLGDWSVQTESPSGPPYWALVERAKEWSADLVVVGSHGRSTLGRLALGGVSHNVLTHAPCSVRIGRDAEAERRAPDAPVRLLVALDGSPDAAAAVEAVCARTWPRGSEAWVATVLDVGLALALHRTAAWPGEEGEGHYDPARRAVEAVADRLRACGLQAFPAVSEGNPKQALVSQAERFGANCVFMGARGHSRLERFLLGSVSSAVAARVHCSVEVVRARVAKAH